MLPLRVLEVKVNNLKGVMVIVSLALKCISRVSYIYATHK
jgi:hypothetical protein